MARDVGDVIGTAIGHVARDAVQTVATNASKRTNGHLSGAKGLAAGAGLVTLAPLATRLVRGDLGSPAKMGAKLAAAPAKKATKKATKKASSAVKDAVGDSVKQAGGATGIAKEAGKGLLPGGGAGKAGGAAGVGKGRRMPVQQAVDVAVPLETAYNQWTQFEQWPEFMHRLDSVSQEDDSHVIFKAKIWGKSKEYKAEIVDQRPDDRIKWRVVEGINHTGVVSFHRLADRLTRIEVTLDVQPGSLIEKAARGMRHIKRAVRADLHRFKAYIELEEEETGAWRGEISEGDVKSAGSGGSSRTRSRASSGPSSRSRSRGSSNGRASTRSRGSSNGSRSRSRSKS